MKTNMDGKPLNVVAMNLAIFGEADPEIPMTRERAFEDFKNCFQSLPPIKGQIMIMGTGSETVSTENFSKLWDK